ncbi:MAG: hypothetical protein R6U64_03610, partial [Bacteroidales bacterium]
MPEKFQLTESGDIMTRFLRMISGFTKIKNEALHASVNAMVPHRVAHGQFMVERTREGRYRKLNL